MYPKYPSAIFYSSFYRFISEALKEKLAESAEVLARVNGRLVNEKKDIISDLMAEFGLIQ